MATVWAAGSGPDGGVEPRRVGRGWLTAWTVANTGMFLTYYATQQVVLPRQAATVTGSSAASVAAQSWANVAAALVTVLVSVLCGAFSDRTTHARGRRQVWVLGGGIVGGAAFVALGAQHSVAGLVVSWAAVQVGIASIATALNAAVPDEVPVRRRATVSAWYGVAQAVGPLIGIVLVTTALTGVLSAYLAIGALLALLVLPFALGTRGARLTADRRPPLGPVALLTGLVRPLRHADFAWAWGGRFFIQLSNALGQIYLYQYLKDRVGVDPDRGSLVLVLVYTVAVVAATLPAGWLSDRSGRRKRMVVVASVLQGAAGLLLALVPTMPAAVVGALMLGVGYGAYVSVDQALVTQVLPSPQDRGRDLGVINVANMLPYVFAAAIGGVVITRLGGYLTLYLLVLLTGVVAALMVAPIKSVR